ncbi:MAG TPA: MoaD/ThiS family protein [Pyrinomonadaceae bacterium]|nr:MoaD/ThiS family protein [Acidobacteriota bacterium]HQZ97595.1 MoaD/ThiS family protein [Pyrinomonadaceae bacterium]
MKVKVLFFGAIADAAGKRSNEIEIVPGSTSKAALEQLLAATPELASRKLLLAINEEYATGDEIIRDGDELAIFTAVSGG